MSKEKSIIPADLVLPNRLAILPIRGQPIFPGILTPVVLKDPADIAVVEQSVKADSFIGLNLTLSEDVEGIEIDDIHTTGTAAKILKSINLPDNGINILISTLKRFQIKKPLQKKPPFVVAVEYLEDDFGNASGNEITALTRYLLSEVKQISENNPLFSEDMRLNMLNIDHPGKIADFIVSILNIDREQQQKILEMLDIQQRIGQVLIHVKREQELLRLQKKIQKQINVKIEKNQREYFLREELKTIKQELGLPVDAKHSEYMRFKEAAEKLQLSGEAKEQVELELEKFSLMEPSSPEFQVSRNYLETIISLPWRLPPPQEIDISRAERVLNADHYGLNEVKERILEFIAVGVLRKNLKGSIICLVGPPGVGKTSVGRSIARALERKFFRFSVGGMRDEAEIKGHRRTYIGAMPGKIIQGLKVVKSANPVFMIDEIDKLGVSFQGDPSSALLEVLDPEQNVSFRDHYLDLPFDISNILFITTANVLESIPSPLLNRMEVMRLPGYIDDEKVTIARKYIIPRSLTRNSLTKGAIKYNKRVLLQIAHGYAREAGMRNFEKAVDKIHRKLARRIVTDGPQPTLVLDDEQLAKLLGQPLFRDDQQHISRPGMAIGLAWTALGGETLVIEAVSNRGKEGFSLTGQMGEVMQESARIAYTWVRSAAESFGISNAFFEHNHIHLHIPAGATPKDGPSAGITMASCLLSLARNRPIRKRLAMTGELSLIGQVLAIGGLREKIVAARRGGQKEIIIPQQNQRDLEEIPEYIRRSLKFHSVSTMDEVTALL